MPDLKEGTSGKVWLCPGKSSVALVRLERVMNLGKNRIEMRIPQSAWFPRDLCFLHS